MFDPARVVCRGSVCARASQMWQSSCVKMIGTHVPRTACFIWAALQKCLAVEGADWYFCGLFVCICGTCMVSDKLFGPLLAFYSLVFTFYSFCCPTTFHRNSLHA